MRKTIQTIRTGNKLTADGMNVGMIIDDKGLEEEVDSFGIETYELVDLASASFAIKRGTDAQTVRTKTELTWNSVRIVE